uniref:Uncharacterized protein n=1 Tax=Arundo donax TaxID=35708 RepID=A0A0A9BXM9_ARUDO
MAALVGLCVKYTLVSVNWLGDFSFFE